MDFGREDGRMRRILCVGMMVCDTLLFPVPADVLERDSVSIQTPVTSCGGDALNVAMALSRLGAETAICGRVGQDKNGAYIQTACQETKIDTSGITVLQHEKGAGASVLQGESGAAWYRPPGPVPNPPGGPLLRPPRYGRSSAGIEKGGPGRGDRRLQF